eukprot:3389113-Prorocentrum_lima.AAC.1
MTSSLVGSEMCIRDRTLIVRRAIACHSNGTRSSSAARKEGGGDGGGGGGAVSYTHLTLPTICSV